MNHASHYGTGYAQVCSLKEIISNIVNTCCSRVYCYVLYYFWCWFLRRSDLSEQIGRFLYRSAGKRPNDIFFKFIFGLIISFEP
jgi:hypothetical protein